MSTTSEKRMDAQPQKPAEASRRQAGPPRRRLQQDRETGTTTARPAFPALRATTSDHLDTVVLDEWEHHHPHDSDLEEEDEREEHEADDDVERRSDQTLRNEQDASDSAEQETSGRTTDQDAVRQRKNKQQGDLRDAEKGHRPDEQPRPKARERSATEASRQRKDPESRAWKDDIVTFDSASDPANPKNWTFRHKTFIVMLFGMTTMSSTYASSSISSALGPISTEFGISREVSILAISLFILGYVPGPIIFAPLSELYGRKIAVLGPVAVFACFVAATATATNVQTLMITRFFGGIFASAPVACVGGGLADLFDARERGTAVVFYSLAVVAGPTLSPIISAAVTQSYLGWRWSQYLTLILVGVVLCLDLLFLPETFAPVILTRKARQIRWKTQRWGLHSRQEMQPISIKTFMTKNLVVPLRMIALEPIVSCVTLYNSFAYGILYMLFAAVPIVYEQERGYGLLVSALPFLAVLLGCLTAAAINVLYSQLVYAKRLDKLGSVEPELRLWPMALGSITFPIGFFLLGWTSDPSINWFPSVLGLYFIGNSFLLIFQGGINYLIDLDPMRAASAVAANTFMRSLFAAGLPLVAGPMFNNLGVNWACTLLGCIAVLLAIIPFLFIKFGKTLRQRSKQVDA